MRWLGDQVKLLERQYWPKGHSQVIRKEKNCPLLSLAILFQETGYHQRELQKSYNNQEQIILFSVIVIIL